MLSLYTYEPKRMRWQYQGHGNTGTLCVSHEVTEIESDMYTGDPRIHGQFVAHGGGDMTSAVTLLQLTTRY
jgi:hypothetical protein